MMLLVKGRGLASVLLRRSKGIAASAMFNISGRKSSSIASSVYETVEVQKFVSPSPKSQVGTNTYRLPNDVRERNALYSNESDRSMSGVEARVRNVRASHLDFFGTYIRLQYWIDFVDGNNPFIVPFFFLFYIKSFSFYLERIGQSQK